MRKGFIIVGMFVAFSLLFPLAAKAACSVSGEVVRIFDDGTSTFVYLRSLTLGPFYYLGATTNDHLRAAARSCESSRHRCTLIGNLTSCPTTGTSRNIGNLTSVYTNP
jgi:hypothetical protein